VAVSNKVPIDADTIGAASALRLICVAATGVNNIDLEAAAAHDVTVCNATGYATPAVVQHVFALLLALATRLEHYHAAARGGRWAAHPFFCVLDEPITELAGRTLGIVGHGELGRGVAGVARAFGMEVLVAARRGAPAREGRIAFDELLERADAVSLHCPLTDETRGLIGSQELRRLGEDAILINVARGGVVDQDALVRALQYRTIGGAALSALSITACLSCAATGAPATNSIAVPSKAVKSRGKKALLLMAIPPDLCRNTDQMSLEPDIPAGCQGASEF
jgi:glycerate dehydrogenase